MYVNKRLWEIQKVNSEGYTFIKTIKEIYRAIDPQGNELEVIYSKHDRRCSLSNVRDKQRFYLRFE